MRAFVGTLAVAASACAVLASGASSQTPGTVRGIVYDSTTHEPLADAAVILWDTPYRTASGVDGAFELTGVPAGRYDLVFYHQRLGALGFSAGPTSVMVASGEVTEVTLATPSAFTLEAAQCLLEEGAPGSGVVAGWVGDAESGMGLPGAQVLLAWNEDDRKAPRRMYYRTDSDGWYRACTAPADVPITASATFLDRQSPRREITVGVGQSVEAGFLLQPLRPAAVSGRMVDADSGEGIGDIEIWLRGTSFRGLSGPGGAFSFSDVPPGTYMLMADHIRYGTKMDTLEVPSGQTLSVEMRLDTRPIEIAPITVTVEAEPLTLRAMGGITVTRGDIDKVQNRVRDVADILKTQNLPGLIVTRNANSVCIGYMPGQVRMMFRNACVPMLVFIDNVRATNTDLAVQIPPDAIERIVIYRPIEAGNLFGLGAGNGVLAIFTRGH